MLFVMDHRTLRHHLRVTRCGTRPRTTCVTVREHWVERKSRKEDMDKETRGTTGVSKGFWNCLISSSYSLFCFFRSCTLFFSSLQKPELKVLLSWSETMTKTFISFLVLAIATVSSAFLPHFNSALVSTTSMTPATIMEGRGDAR